MKKKTNFHVLLLLNYYSKSAELGLKFLDSFRVSDPVITYHLYCWCEMMKREYKLSENELVAVNAVENDYCSNWLEFNNDPNY